MAGSGVRVNPSRLILVGPAQAIAGEIDAMGIVDEAVENGVGISRIADHLVPFVDRDLARQDGRAPAVAFFEDLVQVAAGAGVERIEAPIIENEELVPVMVRMMRA